MKEEVYYSYWYGVGWWEVPRRRRQQGGEGRDIIISSSRSSRVTVNKRGEHL